MGYVRHIGRVGALAVALGVGMAVATTPGIAYAEPSDSGSASSSTRDSASTTTSSSTRDSASTTKSSTTRASSAGGGAASPSGGAASPGGSDGTDSSASGVESPSGSADGPSGGSVKGPTTGGGDGDTPPAAGDEDTPRAAGEEDSPPAANPAAAASAYVVVSVHDSVGGDSADQQVASKQVGGGGARVFTRPDASEDAESPVAAAAGQSTRSAAGQSTGSVGQQSQTPSVAAVADAPARRSLVAPASADVLTTGSAAVEASAPPAPTVQDLPHILVRVASQLVDAALAPMLATGPRSPTQSPLLWAVLAWVRRETERTIFNNTPDVGPVPAAAVLVESPNLLVDPGAELGDPSLSGYSSVTAPGWTVTGTPTVIKYGTLRRFPSPFASPGPTLPAFLGFPSSNSAPPGSGMQFFGGGPVATSTLTQTVDLSAAASDIDTGTVAYTLSGDLGGFLIDPSATSVTVDFLDANGVKLGTGGIEPVTVFDRGFQTGLFERETSGTIPVGTRSALVVATFTDRNPVLGNYNNAYADNLSFTVGAALPAPPPPTPPVSTVGQLDHVFMVYMENKGFTDIVGSPNAPFLNSLINTYGFGSNYFALTHPSDPNYYPILGGSDFGINYNCPANCFEQPNLADNIEAAGLTWAGYAEGGGGYATTDRLPFLAFSNIYSDPDRVETHLFDLTQLEHDLASPATTPNFVWFAADDATNMEGPLEGFGIVLWALSQLTNHQYNVAAGDKWLQDTVPIILNSPVWQDPTQKSAIFLTFDEDYNNISLGIGNQGNHIIMVVIPSPGAVASGMRGGAFVADDYNNHYGLLRTIEESLGLPPLTNNDRFAQPMNEYWL